MKSFCNNGKYEASHHVEHIKQMASLQTQLRDHQRHLHYQVGDKLDDCLVMLADGHDQVMNAMIKELRDIVNSGHARRDMEPRYQEQDDHPLTRLSHALQLSTSATTSLACTDKATLEELTNKVARQQARIAAAESILALPWHLAYPELQKLKSQEKREEPQSALPRCTHQCQSQGCSEQCIYDAYHSQSMQPGAITHKCKELDSGRTCRRAAEATGPWLTPSSQGRQPISEHLEAPQVELTVPSEATTGNCTVRNSHPLKFNYQDGSRELTQVIEEIDPWLTRGASIKRYQHNSYGHQFGIEPSQAVQVNQLAPSEVTTRHQAPILAILENFLLMMIGSLRRLHGTLSGALTSTLRRLPSMVSAWHCREDAMAHPQKTQATIVTLAISAILRDSTSKHLLYMGRQEDHIHSPAGTLGNAGRPHRGGILGPRNQLRLVHRQHSSSHGTG